MNEKKRQIMVFLGLAFLISGKLALGEVENRVIMKVNGHVIRASELAIPPKAVGRNTKLNDKGVEETLLKHDISKLKNRIRQIVFNEAITKYGITVTDNEITASVNKSFSDVKITEDTAIKIRGKGLGIAEGLKKVIVHGSDPEVVYSTDLKDMITQREWHAYLSNYDTAAKISSFIESLPRNVADMKVNSRASTRNDLEAERLEQRIYSDISVTDADIASYCQQRLQKNPEEISPELREKIEKRIIVERQREATRMWWKKQISEADIEVFDSGFEGIKNAILKDLSVSEDPQKKFSRRSRVPSKAIETKEE